MKHDNCKDCVSNCEHAGKDREFVCMNGVSCKQHKDTLITIDTERLTEALKISGIDEDGESLISVSDLRKALKISQVKGNNSATG